MKVRIRFLVVIICISTFTFTACKKEKIKGCKTSYATNYKSNAEEDDGSCTYEAKAIFWQNQTNAATWTALGVTSLSFYVDGSLIGTCASNAYYASAPTCSSNGLASVNKSLGNSSSKSFSYSIKDQTGFTWFSGTITLSAENSCTVHQI